MNNNNNSIYLSTIKTNGRADVVSNLLFSNNNQSVVYFCFIGGIRCGELGGVMHGRDPKILEDADEFEEDNGELLRLAIPRRTYTESHMK